MGCLLILGLSVSSICHAKSAEDGVKLSLEMAKAAYNFGYVHGDCDPKITGSDVSERLSQSLVIYKNLCDEGIRDKREGRQAKPDQAGISFAEVIAVAAIRDKKDFDAAYKWFEVAAEAGRVSAQLMLGAMYRDGAGGRQECQRAAMWLQKAAQGGDAEAQFNLGVMYHDGKCIERNYAKAVELYGKGAEQSHTRSWTNLGVMLINGQGNGPNPAGAYFYWRVASELGDTYATELLQSVEFTDEQRKAGDESLREMLKKR